MNSKLLKFNNQEVYKEFFNKYDLIISCPIIFSITSINTWFTTWNSFSIMQKLWLRNYIWIDTKSYDNDIEFIYKENIVKDFQKASVNEFYPISRQVIDKIWLKYKIWFLSEYNRIDTPSIISDIIISKLLIDNEINTQDIQNLDIEKTEHQKTINKIFETDKKRLKDFNFFWSLRNSNYYLWLSILKSNSHIISLEKNFNTNYINLGKNNFFDNLDMCFYILNPNIFSKPIFQSDILFEEGKKIQKIWKKYNIDTKNNNLAESIDNMSKHYSLECFENLSYLYKQNERWNKFFKNMPISNNLTFAIYRDQYKNLLKHNEIKKIIKKSINNKDIEIAITQSWNRIQIYWNRQLKITNKDINQINNSLWYNFTLDYSSNEDWFEVDWVKIEQRKSKWILWEFTSENTIKDFWSNWISTEFFDYKKDWDNILKKKKNLILDTINNKMFINSKKMTSKDIHSQSWTIEILKQLLNKQWNEISNKDLSPSSYSKNKNEMIWKIIIPLIKIFEKNTWEKLKLICKWSIYDFYIKLNLPNNPISIIEKI